MQIRMRVSDSQQAAIEQSHAPSHSPRCAPRRGWESRRVPPRSQGCMTAASSQRAPNEDLSTGSARTVFVRTLAMIGTAAMLAVAGSAFGSASQAVRGPFALVSLPALGAVSWRCAPGRVPGVAPGLPGLALGFSAQRATARVRLGVRGVAGAWVSVQPGETVRFPFLRSRLQQLELVQFTGAGTLRASVSVDFVPGGSTTYCYDYLPPKVSVRVQPRR